MMLHEPVMISEVLRALDLHSGSRIIDGTVGDGGHAEAILERTSPHGELLGIDADPHALAVAAKRLQRFGSRVHLVQDNFQNIAAIARREGCIPTRGILLDLGLRSTALEGSGRGFSFLRDEPLDMRFDPSSLVTAASLVNTATREELRGMISRYGQDRFAGPIADGIVAARREREITTTQELVRVIDRSIPRAAHRGKIHFATKTFQALRIAANHELESLEDALRGAAEILEPGGRLVVISYHSLEDRIVKRFSKLTPAVRGVITPDKGEIRKNPRSRSAKMRVLEKNRK